MSAALPRRIGDTGLVVPPRSPQPLAEACLVLLRDDALRHRLGAAARARALEHFTVDGAISTFDEIYTSSAPGSRCRPPCPGRPARRTGRRCPGPRPAALAGHAG